MAEYCKDCVKTVLQLSDKDLKRVVLSKELDLCEGCGEIKPVVVKIKPSLATIWDNIGYKLRGGV